MEPLRQLAHAKINLALRVLSRDPNGYHRIETFFQRLALADTIALRPTDGPRALDVVWEGARAVPLGPAPTNLAWRAAAEFAALTGWPRGWEIQLTKRIPAGGGLGGGSADAAAVLRILNTLAPAPLGAAALHALATRLGADVPFALSGASLALGTAYGEQLLPLAPLPSVPVTLILPDFGVNTAAAYGALAEARRALGAPAPTAQFTPAVAASWASLAAAQVNDFEPIVCAMHPQLAETLVALAGAGAHLARMSGSGSTLFAIGAAPIPLPPGWAQVETTSAA
jgi:4-diphosphocytidyl-2-C-methyl-D-erythritol kinase